MLAFGKPIGNSSHEHELNLTQVPVLIKLRCQTQLLKQWLEILGELDLSLILNNLEHGVITLLCIVLILYR